MNTEKNRLRVAYYALRQQITTQKPEVQQELQKQILYWLNQQTFRIVGFYRPFRAEPDITPALLTWSKQNPDHRLAVPRVDSLKSRTMHYCQWDSKMKMRSGAFGIEEPEDDWIVVPDVVFSPCVAVSSTGYRLGNGGGFFDQYLSHQRDKVQTVAVAYEALVSDQIPNDSFDQSFDWIVTEKGFRKVRFS